MVGKKSSLPTLKRILIVNGIPVNQIFETSFAQGVTHRWGLAWTFIPEAARLYHAYIFLQKPDVQLDSKASEIDSSGSGMPFLSTEVDPEQFQKTMLSKEKESLPSATESNILEYLAWASRNRLADILPKLAETLSSQNYQGFEEFSYMTPLGVTNNIKWDIGVAVEEGDFIKPEGGGDYLPCIKKNFTCCISLPAIGNTNEISGIINRQILAVIEISVSIQAVNEEAMMSNSLINLGFRTIECNCSSGLGR